MAIPASGGCHDGLEPHGVNLNQGAESTLMWLTALEHMRDAATSRADHDAAGEPARDRAHRRARRQGVMPVDPDRDAQDVLFRRHPANPLITVADLPYRANAVFNPGAARVGDDTVLLVRVEDMRGISHLVVARSHDGVSDWRFDDRPLLEAQPERNPEEIWGCEDPRLTWLPGARGLGDHLHGLQRPRSPRVAGHDAGLHRRPPQGPGHAARGQGRGDLPAPVRRPLGDAPPALAAARQRPHLDLVLTGPPPLGRPRPPARGARRRLVGRRARSGSGRRRWRPPDGWLLCYHGVHATSSGPIYRVGLALLDLDDPRVVLNRTDEWVMGPSAPYEIQGDVNKVVFPNGWVHDPVTDVLSLYYGAGDKVVALATARLADVIAHVRAAPQPHHRRASDPPL